MQKLVLVLLLTLAPLAAHAIEPPARSWDRHTVRELPLQWFTKLGNGLANVGLGFMELPFHMINETNNTVYEDSNPMVGMFRGALVGTGFSLARLGAGLFEIVTFPVDFAFEPIVPPPTQYELTFGRD